ncbi:MAG: 16S rRNA (adenine(1518)-N(6)/adenine(1519)-N(6))-dimethyltransferase RsmA [Thermoprotei archaeon]
MPQTIARMVPLDVEVVEVGGGLGALTEVLRKKTKRLTVVEIDKKLAGYLESRFEGIKVIHADILKIDIPATDYVVSALPYSISKKFVLKLVRDGDKWRHALLILQKEFADKLTAQPCEKNYREISVLAQYSCIIRPLVRVPRRCFYPQPRVDSVLMLLSIKDSYSTTMAQLLADIVLRLFSYRNRSVRTAIELSGLSSQPRNLSADLLKTRVSCLSVEGFVELAKKL